MQVQQPSCNQQSSHCDYKYKQCCQVIHKVECNTCPVQITVNVKQYVPGPIVPIKKCYKVPITKPGTTWTLIDDHRTVTKHKCIDKHDKECLEFQKPQQDIISNNKTDSVELTFKTCTKGPDKVIKKCITIDEGKRECVTKIVTKKFEITSTLCNKKEPTPQQCQHYQVPTCYEHKFLNCRWSVKLKCVKECGKNDYCNTCSQFMTQPGSGYGSCPTSTCQNYVGGHEPSYGGGHEPSYGGGHEPSGMLGHGQH